MKRVLAYFAAAGLGLAFGTSALAADISPAPVYKGPPPPLPFSWSGFYIGAQGGAGWGTTTDFLTSDRTVAGLVSPFAAGITSSYGINGWHGGGTVGFNWQLGPVVLGVEGDASGADINGAGDCSNIAGVLPAAITTAENGDCHTKLKSFETVTGRFGIPIDRTLWFVKAGGVWGQFDHNVNFNSSVAGGAGLVNVTNTVGDDRSGVTAGVGVEYAFAGNWSAKLEYDYLDFGTKNLAFPVFATTGGARTGTFNVDDQERVHIIKAGVSYRFNWWQ